MADDAENMGLTGVLVDGITHGLTIDGQALVIGALLCVPALQGTIQMHRIDSSEHIADDGSTGNLI